MDERVNRAIKVENTQRHEIRDFLQACSKNDALFSFNGTINRWIEEVQHLHTESMETVLRIEKLAGDPAWAKEKQTLGKAAGYRFPGEPYGYSRAFQNSNDSANTEKELVVLDPTSGGGSIPFEALRLGYDVIANELNPVASVILHATLDYPARWGLELRSEIESWGSNLLQNVQNDLEAVFPDKQALPDSERSVLEFNLKLFPEYVENFDYEEIMDYLYCRQVTCPNCGGEAPLLNTCWLSKEAGKQWGVKIIPTVNPRMERSGLKPTEHQGERDPRERIRISPQ